MIKICHRINTIDDLQKTPAQFGVEVDIHAYGKDLIVHHDPFEKGVLFEKWLDHYNHSFVILNIKEEGIEKRVKPIMDKYGIKNFFMLDLSFPALIKMVRQDERRIAARLSKYESLTSILSLSGMCDWVWVDLFDNKLPFSKEQYNELKKNNFKLCLVSPELHGKNIEDVYIVQQQISNMDIKFDAVCTKQPSKWNI